jgi:hypothetical protein
MPTTLTITSAQELSHLANAGTLRIAPGCGVVVEYKDPAGDVPLLRDVPCPCGRHLLITWQTASAPRPHSIGRKG